MFIICIMAINVSMHFNTSTSAYESTIGLDGLQEGEKHVGIHETGPVLRAATHITRCKHGVENIHAHHTPQTWGAKFSFYKW